MARQPDALDPDLTISGQSGRTAHGERVTQARAGAGARRQPKTISRIRLMGAILPLLPGSRGSQPGELVLAGAHDREAQPAGRSNDRMDANTLDTSDGAHGSEGWKLACDQAALYCFCTVRRE